MVYKLQRKITIFPTWRGGPDWGMQITIVQVVGVRKIAAKYKI